MVNLPICCRNTKTDEDAKNSCSCLRFCIKKGSGGPSNLTLLSTAFVSFLIFTAAQLCAALVANSQSMLADTGAMSVDICSYALNWFAERKKCNVSEKRQQLLLELIAPSFSVIALLGITIYSLHGSIITLTPGHAATLPSNQPNLIIMLIFSSMNLALDILNVSCFARAKKLFGFKVSPMTIGVDTTLQSQRNECRKPSNTDDFVVDGTESICEKGFISSGDQKDPSHSDASNRFDVHSNNQSSLFCHSSHVRDYSNVVETSEAGKGKVSDPEESDLVEHDVEEDLGGSNSQSNVIIDKSFLKNTESHTKCCTVVDDTIEHSVAAIPSDFTPNLNMCSAYTVRNQQRENQLSSSYFIS
jgi:Co/Zn/Cd efflux system component